MRFASVLVLIAVIACARSRETPPGSGRRLVSGPVRALIPSPDGGSLAYLDRCARPPAADLPPDLLVCDLGLIATTGGTARRLAEGVSSLPSAVAWSPDGKALAALADFDYATGRGRLVFVDGEREPRALADGVHFFGFAPAGRALALVARGRLMVKRSEEAEPREVPGADAVATFEFAPRSADPSPRAATLLLAARRAASAGGDLIGVSGWEGRAVPIAAQVGDYGFGPLDRLAFTTRGREGYSLALVSTAIERSPAGERLRAGASPVGANVQRFSFAPVGGAVAFLANVAPGKAGELFAMDGSGAGRPRRMAGSVGDYHWATAAPVLAWLQDFDPRVRAGTLAVGGPEAKTGTFGRNVDNYDLAPDGGRVAYLEHVTAGVYSVDLKVAEVREGAAAETVARGVFGFAFSPDGRRLVYRTNCVRNAEACDLYAAGAPGEKPQRLAEGVKSFEFDRRRPERMLITWSRKDLVALDLAVLAEGKLTAIDQAALPGSVFFLGPDSRRLAYVVADPKRAGVYVADLP